MAFNDFSWLSMLQKTFFCCLSDATEKTLSNDKTRHNQTITKSKPAHRNILSTHIFPQKVSLLLFFEAHLVTICYIFFPFLHHDIICLSGTNLKLIYREWEYRNNPMSIWQKEFTGCKIGEKRREGEGVSSAKKINPMDHSSSLPLASDWS